MSVETKMVRLDKEMAETAAASVEVLLRAVLGDGFSNETLYTLSREQMERLNAQMAATVALMSDIQLSLANGTGFAATLRSFILALEAGKSPVQRFQTQPGDETKH